MKIYSIYDMAVGAYLAPFFQPNDLAAIRAFAVMVNDGQSLFSKSPQDFSLTCFGEFDEQNGTFTCDGPPRGVRAALALVERDGDSRQVPLFDKDAALAAMQKSLTGEKADG